MRQLLRDIREYQAAYRRWRNDHPGAERIQKRYRHFGRWRRLRHGQTSPLFDQQPWLTFAAGEFLSDVLTSEARVFEWGMGGSSLFFSGLCREVVSVEDNPEWYRVCQEQFTRSQVDNWTGVLALPERKTHASAVSVSDWRSYRSSGPDLEQNDYRQYVSVIDRFEDGSFDCVVVDGRARPACVRHALTKVCRGGWLVLDNAERAAYQPTLLRLPSACWERRDFSGPGPYVSQFWMTSVFQRTGAPLNHVVEHAA